METSSFTEQDIQEAKKGDLKRRDLWIFRMRDRSIHCHSENYKTYFQPSQFISIICPNCLVILSNKIR